MFQVVTAVLKTAHSSGI